METVEDAERFVEDVGFAAGFTDSRRPGPSLYVAVCGRRDAVLPRNVQKDPETSLTWELKDEIMGRGKVYYGKLARGKPMFLAPRVIPYFHAVWGMRRSEEKQRLSRHARAILKALRKEWEMGTADLRSESGVKDRAAFMRGLDELQRALIVIPTAAAYAPKFTYIWSLGIDRFPDELAQARESRDGAARNSPLLSRCRRHDRPGRAGACHRTVETRSRARQSCPRRSRVCDAAAARNVQVDLRIGPVCVATRGTRAYITQRAKSRRRTACRRMCRGDCPRRDELRGPSCHRVEDLRLANGPHGESVHGQEGQSRSSKSTNIHFATSSRTWVAGHRRESCMPRSLIEGDHTRDYAWPDQGYRMSNPEVTERRALFAPAGDFAASAAALGHNLAILDADGPIRHVVPFVRTGDRAMPSLGLAAGLRAAGVKPSEVKIDGTTMIAGDRRMPLELREVNNPDGRYSYLWGLINFRGPALLADLKSRPYPTRVFRSLLANPGVLERITAVAATRREEMERHQEAHAMPAPAVDTRQSLLHRVR